MNQLHAFLQSRMWACEATALQAWAASKESPSALVDAGMTPRERADRVMRGENPLDVQVRDGVATIPVQGVLLHNGPWWAKLYGDTTDYLDLRAAIAAVQADPAVKSVVLSIDSPGGDAVGLAETVAAIRQLAEAKPVAASVMGVCASAAYYLASACDEITAEADSLVGSIGTLAVLADTSGLQERIGIKLVLVSSSPLKGGGADGRVTDAVKADTQRLVDALAATFKAQVAAGRGLSAEQTDALATGQVWLATDAQAKGLIDSTGPRAGQPTSAPAASAEAEPPAAAAATAQKESAMDANLKAALAALTHDHPTQAAALVAEAMKEGATAASLHAFAAKAAVTAATEATAKAQADLKAEREAHDKTKAELADMKARHDKLAALHNGAKDPGAGDPPHQMAKLDKSAFDALSPQKKAAYLKVHGYPAA